MVFCNVELGGWDVGGVRKMNEGFCWDACMARGFGRDWVDRWRCWIGDERVVMNSDKIGDGVGEEGERSCR